MARKCFYSFQYKPDNWRVSTIRKIGTIEGNQTVSDNKWEEVTNGGATAIEKWIDGEMTGKSCAIVLIGAGTAGRKWIDYEIKKAWTDKKGLVGVHIHNILDSKGAQANKGSNPFSGFNVGEKKLSSIVKTYDPPFTQSTSVYKHIADNIEDWVEEAIEIRKNI